MHYTRNKRIWFQRSCLFKGVSCLIYDTYCVNNIYYAQYVSDVINANFCIQKGVLCAVKKLRRLQRIYVKGVMIIFHDHSILLSSSSSLFFVITQRRNNNLYKMKLKKQLCYFLISSTTLPLLSGGLFLLSPFFFHLDCFICVSNKDFGR